MLIDQYLPTYHFSEKHSITIRASKQSVFTAIQELTPAEISPIFKLLFFIRSIPPRLMKREYLGFDSKKPLLKQMQSKGFRIMEGSNSELLIGFLLMYNNARNPIFDEQFNFKEFNQAGTGKVTANFFIEEGEKQIELSTETRIYLCDSKTKMKFTLYWTIVYPGSALIRRIWLKAIKRKAEQSSLNQRFTQEQPNP